MNITTTWSGTTLHSCQLESNPISLQLFFDHDGKRTIIGHADVYHEYDGVYLGNFEIYEGYRNKGLGSKILKLLIKRYGVDTLIVEASNVIAVELYQSFGFQIRKEYHADDLDADVYYMKRQ